ncbi:AraC family transcriptional regulator [uncultured Finegoldia sp.]|uniref:helix-turn-helix transcriptional regulator n=1 Tax=uncultured Finegoldia sp. TaxID=328009 RepID=UPI00262E887E|nr:AraC family transcriptional regulator [uncultured Finegoldia sp.]
MNSEFYKIEPRDDLYIKLLYISKTTLEMNEQIERGILPFHHLYYCLKGSGTFEVNGEKIYIQPFDFLIVYQESTIKEISKSESFEFYTLAISEVSFDTEQKDKAVLSIKHNHINDREMVILHYINKILDEAKYKRFRYQRVCSCLVSILITEVQRRGDLKFTMDDPAQDSFTKNVENYIYENFNQEITLDSISEKFMVSKSHLIHEFKNHYGKTPMQFLLKRRMDSAKLLLKTSNKPISDISKLCGFNSQSYFDQAFRRVVKVTPNDYRNKYKTKIKKIKK